MRRRLNSLICATGLALATAANAQKPVPIITLPPATVKSTEKLGNAFGLRQGASGTVLVNDAAHRQLKLFDASLTLIAVVADSVDGAPNSYGPARQRLIPYF